MTQSELKRLAQTLSEPEFEYFLRERMKGVFACMPEYNGSIIAIVSNFTSEGPQITYTLGNYGKLQTSGELLHTVLREHQRRTSFGQYCQYHPRIEHQ
jgi:hypothetical protein